MNLLIRVIGSIHCGKTTLCEHLTQLLDIPYVSIDQYRRIYYNGKVEGEYDAKDLLRDALIDMDSAILEHSGVGEYAIQYTLSFKHIISIHCHTSMEEIIHGIKERGTDYNYYIPQSWIKSDPISNAITAAKNIHSKLPGTIPIDFNYNYKIDDLSLISIKIRDALQCPRINGERQ